MTSPPSPFLKPPVTTSPTMSTSVNLASDSPYATSQKLSNARLPVLKSPGPDSNYLDWELVVLAYLEAANLDYVVTQPMPVKPTDTWSADNRFVCAVITQAVDSSNLRYVREHRRDAHRMWAAIMQAHQDSSTGGRVYWIRKLLLAKMETDDMMEHIDTMAKYHERLASLVTKEKPLTADDVHSAALLSSIPQDWLHCVSKLTRRLDTAHGASQSPPPMKPLAQAKPPLPP
ncbi:hypothetical protein VP01_371g6 [Puccinia sorghi]|uniref:Retrotransposon Copia-like N-terminal domain-containing protein n=1 Tax=Puccinia sorghi TaxID=27349 RepID=A0A0L6UU15_9BASI|nr:hypothetical protein VP01_371g6 [Puccinia sorghi]